MEYQAQLAVQELQAGAVAGYWRGTRPSPGSTLVITGTRCQRGQCSCGSLHGRVNIDSIKRPSTASTLRCSSPGTDILIFSSSALAPEMYLKRRCAAVYARESSGEQHSSNSPASSAPPHLEAAHLRRLHDQGWNCGVRPGTIPILSLFICIVKLHQLEVRALQAMTEPARSLLTRVGPSVQPTKRSRNSSTCQEPRQLAEAPLRRRGYRGAAVGA